MKEIKKSRILVADNDTVFCTEVSEFLKQKGYDAYSFHRDINIED